MSRDRVLSILLSLAVVAMVVISVVAKREGNRIGAAAARIKDLNATIDTALERGAAAERREKVWRDSAARAHAAAAAAHVAATISEAAARKLRDDDRARPPLVITDTAAVRAELAQKDTVIAGAFQTIADKNQEISDKDRELVARDSADRERDTKELEAETRYRALQKINLEMKQLVPSRTSRIVTAGKWLLAGVAIGKTIR